MKRAAGAGRVLGILALVPLGLAFGSDPSPESADFKIEAKRAAMGAPPAGTVWAGASKVDITPDNPNAYMAGFMPNRTAKGVHDPLYARCVYLDDGATPLAFIAMDLLGVLSPQVNGIRARLTDRFGPNVTVSATHSHAGPDSIGLWGFGLLVPFSSGKDEAYLARVEEAGARCVREAMARSAPATAVFGETKAPSDISTNFHEPERPGIAKTKDDQLTAVRWIDKDGKGVATLVNYACHVEALHQENRRFTADFAGFLTRELERRHGGVGIFLNGAIGGLITPNIPRETPNPERYKLARQMGLRLAEAADKALAEGGTPWKPAPGDGFRLSHRPFKAPLGNWFFDFYHMVGMLELQTTDDDEEKKLVPSEVTAVAVGPSVWLTVPGEIFPSLGSKYKAAMASRYPFLIGLGNDELGYIMEREEFDDGLYAYEQSMSVSPEMGPRLTEAVRAALAGLGGAAAAGGEKNAPAL